MKRGVWVLKFIVFVSLAIIVFGFLTQTLWNWLIPALFAGPVITFTQALGLLLLIKILFWSPGRHGNHRPGGPFRYYMKQKWNRMSPEERDELKRKMKERWCSWDKSEAPAKPADSNG